MTVSKNQHLKQTWKKDADKKILLKMLLLADLVKRLTGPGDLIFRERLNRILQGNGQLSQVIPTDNIEK